MRRPGPTFARRFIIFILGGTLLFTLVACQAKTLWKGSVKIGLILPFYGYDSGSANAAYFATKVALRERNESGGAGGWWVELVALDDRNSAEVAARRAREVALDPDIMGVIGHLSSDAALGAAPVYRESGLAAIALGATSTDLASAYPELLRMVPDDETMASQALQTITGRLKVQRVAVLHDSSPGHTAVAEAFLVEAGRRGLDVAAVAEIEKDQREYGPFLEALSSNPPQWLIFAGDQFQAGAFARQVRMGPFRDAFEGVRILIAGCACTPDFATIGGEAAKGVLHVSVVGLRRDGTNSGGDGEGSVNGSDNRFETHYRSITGVSPSAHAIGAYNATVYLLGALESAAKLHGRIDRASVRREMRKAIASGGLAESVEFAPVIGSGRTGFSGNGIWLGAALGLYEIDESGYPGELWQQ